MVIMAGIHKIIIRIANSEDLVGLHCLSRHVYPATRVGIFRTSSVTSLPDKIMLGSTAIGWYPFNHSRK